MRSLSWAARDNSDALTSASTALRSAVAASRTSSRSPPPSWTSRRRSPASSSSSASPERASRFAAHATWLGLGSLATSAAASFSPAFFSSLTRASRSPTKSSNGTP